MKYKVGDVVRLKTEDELRNTEGVVQSSLSDGSNGYCKDSSYWINQMNYLFGKEVELEQYMDADDPSFDGWILEDWMIAEKIKDVNTTKIETESNTDVQCTTVRKNQTVELSIVNTDTELYLEVFRFLMFNGYNVVSKNVGNCYEIKGEKEIERIE